MAGDRYRRPRWPCRRPGTRPRRSRRPSSDKCAALRSRSAARRARGPAAPRATSRRPARRPTPVAPAPRAAGRSRRRRRWSPRGWAAPQGHRPRLTVCRSLEGQPVCSSVSTAEMLSERRPPISTEIKREQDQRVNRTRGPPSHPCDRRSCGGDRALPDPSTQAGAKLARHAPHRSVVEPPSV